MYRCAMVDEPDFWRSARLLVRQHGDDARWSLSSVPMSCSRAETWRGRRCGSGSSGRRHLPLVPLLCRFTPQAAATGPPTPPRGFSAPARLPAAAKPGTGRWLKRAGSSGKCDWSHETLGPAAGLGWALMQRKTARATRPPWAEPHSARAAGTRGCALIDPIAALARPRYRPRDRAAWLPPGCRGFLVQPRD